MIINTLPTIGADMLGPIQMVVIASQGTNAVMRKVPRMNNAKSRVGSIARSPATTDGFSEPGKNRRHQ